MSILQMRNTETQRGREPTQGHKKAAAAVGIEPKTSGPLSRALATCSPLAGDPKVPSLSTEEKQY